MVRSDRMTLSRHVYLRVHICVWRVLLLYLRGCTSERERERRRTSPLSLFSSSLPLASARLQEDHAMNRATRATRTAQAARAARAARETKKKKNKNNKNIKNNKQQTTTITKEQEGTPGKDRTGTTGRRARGQNAEREQATLKSNHERI